MLTSFCILITIDIHNANFIEPHLFWDYNRESFEDKDRKDAEVNMYE